MLDQVLNALITLQNADGGWGSAQGRQSNTEATALAVSALSYSGGAVSRQSLLRGIVWLAERQNPDGSWRLNDTATAGSWTISLAMLALASFPEYQPRLINAARWLVAQEGSKPGILAEIILWFRGQSDANRLNVDLIGWPWVPGSFSWVEPTSYALLALKKVRGVFGETRALERIEQGEAMIYDRMCKGGGWNYGNSKVLDYALWPYPDITAIALLALQDRAGDPRNQESVAKLRQTAAEANSGLAACWTTVCLGVYGQDSSAWQERVARRFADNGFLGETKTLALALLALDGKPGPFKV